MKRRLFLQTLAGTCLLGRSQFAPGSPRTRRDEKVVVIGAGMAGLAAAATLARRGVSVTILEARESNRRPDAHGPIARVRGRPGRIVGAWNRRQSDHRTGPQVLRKARATRFEEALAFDIDGTKLEPSDVLRSYLRLEVALSHAAERLPKSGDASLETAVHRAFDMSKWSPAERRRLELAAALTEISDAARLAELSSRYTGEYKQFSGGDHLVVSGYDVVPHYLAKGLDIKTGVVARQIDSRGSDLAVETNSGTLRANRIVITVPLGVLQAGQIRFVPELPSENQSAIHRMGMGVMNKMVLKFDQPFWPPEPHVLVYADQQRGKYPLFLNLLHFTGQPVLVCLVPPSYENALETLTEADAKASAMSVLRTMFGRNAREPLSVLQTRWKADPWSRGSYSFDKLGATPGDRDRLAAPVQGRIFFAGEATHRRMFSTVHGAYLSGCRAGDEILQRLS